MPQAESLSVDAGLHPCLFQRQVSLLEQSSKSDALLDIYHQNWQHYYFITRPASDATLRPPTLRELNGWCHRDLNWIGDGQPKTELVDLIDEAAARVGGKVDPSDVVVDVGGGVGLVSVVLLMQYGPMKIYSVDLDPLATQTLEQFNADAAQSSQLGTRYGSSIIPVTADVTQLRAASKSSKLPAAGTVDFVTGVDITKILVDNHADLQTYYQGILDLLKPQGVFVNVEVPWYGRDNGERLHSILRDAANTACIGQRCQLDVYIKPTMGDQFIVITALRKLK